jgi:hypothetical protein
VVVVVGAPIAGYVGPNGGGKTLAAVVFEVAPALERGMDVFSTVALRHPRVKVLNSWREIMGLQNCVLLLDDISAQLPARGSLGMPPQLLIKLNTLRHDGVRVVWTAPHWRRADIGLREVTIEVTLCRGLLPDRYHRERRDGRWTLNGPKLGPVEGLWRPNRLFRFKTYDATAFDEFTDAKRERLKAVRSAWYWRPWHTEQYLYDTEAPVLIMDHVDEGGWCLSCGGRQKAKVCHCSGALDTGRRALAQPAAEPVLDPVVVL